MVSLFRIRMFLLSNDFSRQAMNGRVLGYSSFVCVYVFYMQTHHIQEGKNVMMLFEPWSLAHGIHLMKNSISPPIRFGVV
jgi:hypothetical protein